MTQTLPAAAKVSRIARKAAGTFVIASTDKCLGHVEVRLEFYNRHRRDLDTARITKIADALTAAGMTAEIRGLSVVVTA